MKIDPSEITIKTEVQGDSAEHRLELPSRYAGMDYSIQLRASDIETARESRLNLISWLREVGVCE